MKIRAIKNSQFFENHAIYNVYGIVINSNPSKIEYLIHSRITPILVDDKDFLICSGVLPENWYVHRELLDSETIIYIGYKKFADPNYVYKLLDWDSKSEIIFLQNKKIIDEWQKDQDIKEIINFFRLNTQTDFDKIELDLAIDFIKYSENELAFGKLYKLAQNFDQKEIKIKLKELLALLGLSRNQEITERYKL